MERTLTKEMKIFNYQEMNKMIKKIICLFGTVNIKYKGNLYPVYFKIAFPPMFPQVPPIFSVINIKPQNF